MEHSDECSIELSSMHPCFVQDASAGEDGIPDHKILCRSLMLIPIICGVNALVFHRTKQPLTIKLFSFIDYLTIK